MTRSAEKECAPLNLAAFDAEDLAVLSAHVQDGLTHVGDLNYAPRTHNFVFPLWRFDWAGAEQRRKQRRLSVLRFNHVRAVRHRGLAQRSKDDVLDLLALAFFEENAPSGQIILDFCGDAAIALNVECLEASLRDLAPVRPVRFKPRHFLRGL